MSLKFLLAKNQTLQLDSTVGNILFVENRENAFSLSEGQIPGRQKRGLQNEFFSKNGERARQTKKTRALVSTSVVAFCG